MAYTKPTTEDFTMRFFAFREIDRRVIQYWLTDAERTVDTSWTETDYAVALMTLAAHNMVKRGLGTDAEAVAIADGTANLRRMRSGTLDLERLDKAVTEADSEYAGTTYGAEFISMLERNRGGPRTTGPGAIPCGYGFAPGYAYPGGYGPWLY